ncbi:DUF3040 domain-containing protein [Streptomyces sp. UG1]|uniref:DUF3040 domain-containing protein n=1 Tax=Streptomyces sp. UG1 TaxID=3417652 RepID=UPI003CF1B9B8
MGDAELSRREERTLAEIEAALKRDDEVLDRSLRTMHLTARHRRLWEEIRRPRGLLVLAVFSLCLLIAAPAALGATVIWPFATAWLVTLLIGFSLLRRRTNRPRG